MMSHLLHFCNMLGNRQGTTWFREQKNCSYHLDIFFFTRRFMLNSKRSYLLTTTSKMLWSKDANIQPGLESSQPSTAANELYDLEYIPWSLWIYFFTDGRLWDQEVVRIKWSTREKWVKQFKVCYPQKMFTITATDFMGHKITTIH